MSANPPTSALPAGLTAPAVAALISAVLLAVALLLTSEGPGGGVVAVPFALFGSLAGAASTFGLWRGWRVNRGSDRPRRAAWIAATALLLAPFALLVGVLVLGLVYTVLFVRP